MLGVRGTGLHWKYAKLIGEQILARCSAKVIYYGQVGKLSEVDIGSHADRCLIIPHSELQFFQKTGFGGGKGNFKQGLQHRSYFLDQKMVLPQNRQYLFKATIETTRGCHFGCRFCFINHGTNYDERYARRPAQDVVEDVKYYVNRGISNFWFYDSEFIGVDAKTYSELKMTLELLSELRQQSHLQIMVYARADTLIKFDDFVSLRKAGINNVLMGIESFSDADSKAMRKSQTKQVALDAIRRCVENEIFCHLSFILFNRGATLATIEENVETVAKLYGGDNFVYLGQTHYLSYAFESDWKKDGKLHRALSGDSRLIGSTSSTLAADSTVVFDPVLEPVAEIFRIINYEQIRKLSQLTIDLSDSSEQRESLHHWATLLSLFVVNLMATTLHEYKNGHLTLNTLDFFETWVYLSFAKFNNLLLPNSHSHTITDKSGYDTVDWNGWDVALYSE